MRKDVVKKSVLAALCVFSMVATSPMAAFADDIDYWIDPDDYEDLLAEAIIADMDWDYYSGVYQDSFSDTYRDYSVHNVSVDVSDNNVTVYWDTGSDPCNYTVQLYNSADLKKSHKVGSSSSVSYNKGYLDITSKVISAGAGRYYVCVTCSKKSNGSYDSDVDYFEVTSRDIQRLRGNRSSGSGSPASSSGAPVVSAGGPSSSGTSSYPSGGARWQQNSDGTWTYYWADGSHATGWFQVNGKWYFSDGNGIMLASAWIPSESEANTFFYVGADGAMLVNTYTPDGYYVDGEGKYRRAGIG